MLFRLVGLFVLFVLITGEYSLVRAKSRGVVGIVHTHTPERVFLKNFESVYESNSSCNGQNQRSAYISGQLFTPQSDYDFDGIRLSRGKSVSGRMVKFFAANFGTNGSQFYRSSGGIYDVKSDCKQKLLAVGDIDRSIAFPVVGNYPLFPSNFLYLDTSFHSSSRSGGFNGLSADSSRKRCKTNHADFCVMPISLESCIEEMPLRAVTSRYIA